jgi:polyhydroxyalkanoate synthesis regulator phasin
VTIEGGLAVSEVGAAPKSFGEKVEGEIRADLTADENLGKQIIADLIEKVEALERRIAKLEHRS